MFQDDFKNPTTLQTTHYGLSTIALSESVENTNLGLSTNLNMANLKTNLVCAVLQYIA